MITADYKFDLRPLQEFLIAMKDFGRDSIAVGVVGPEAVKVHPETTLQTWEVGALQEFGNEHIPSRPFIRNTFANRAWVRDTLAGAARAVIRGRSARSAMNRAGKILADGVRATLLAGTPPANAAATVDWKGHGDTLIGLTGALYDAIGHMIIPGGK
jgi:hypothetical protein